MQVYLGTAVQTTATFKNPTGTTTDPTTVTLAWGNGGSVTTWTYGTGTEITKLSAGVYRAAIPTTTADETLSVTLKWTGTGTCEAVGVTTFDVKRPPI